MTNKKEIKKAVLGIIRGFVWKDTKQGQKYWETVEDNLKEMLEELKGGKKK
jgi:hypothetical protein